MKKQLLYLYILSLFIVTSCGVSNNSSIKNEIKELINKGVVQMQSNPNGVSSFNFFRSAELLYESNKLKDPLLIGDIYLNIAKINYNVGNYSQAQEYAQKRYSLNNLINNDSINLVAQIDYSYIEIELAKFNKARELIDELTLKYKVPNELNGSVLALEATYFELIGDYDLAIEFYKTIDIKSFNDTINRAYFLARNYLSASELDSAKLYANNLLLNITGKDLKNSYLYYTLAADIYVKANDYKKATELYSNSCKHYSLDIDKVWDNKILESEIKYGVLESKQQILRLKELSYRLILLFTIIISIILIYYLLLKSAHKRDELKLKINETKLENIELIKKLMEVSLESMPSFQDEVYNLVARNQKASNEIMPEYISISSDMKKKIKKKFASIIDEPGILNINPLFSKMGEYTTSERMIVYLLFLNYNSSFIARVLQTSTGSIRGTKANIRKRTMASVVLSEQEKQELLHIIDK